MKKRSLCLAMLFVALGLGLASPLTAQIRFGVTAGLNFDRLTDITVRRSVSESAETNFESKNGWHAEVWADVSVLGLLSLRPGVRYLQAGQLFEGFADIDGRIDDNFDVNLVEIPVLLRLKFGAPVIKPYILAGPVVRFTSSIHEWFNDDVKSPSLAGELGLGVELPLGGIRLYPEIAFTFGLSKFINDELDVGITSFIIDDTQHLNVAMLRLGVGF